MDPTSLFSGSDNFFKYIAIGGFLFLIISIFYPLKKKQEIAIEIITYEKEVKLLNLEIKDLSVKTNSLVKDSDTYLNQINKLIKGEAENLEDSIAINKATQALNHEFLVKTELLKTEKTKLDIKSIILEFNQRSIQVKQGQLNTYKWYSIMLIITGIILMVYGSIGWHKSTHLTEKIKEAEKGLKEKELQSS